MESIDIFVQAEICTITLLFRCPFDGILFYWSLEKISDSGQNARTIVHGSDLNSLPFTARYYRAEINFVLLWQGCL